MRNKKNKLINSFTVAAIVAISFIVVATILGELYKPFKNSLKDIFSHHWIGKGVVATIIFYLLGFIKYHTMPDDEMLVIKILRALFWVSLIGVFAITVFYFYEYFIVH